jgi:hypothetical protein
MLSIKNENYRGSYSAIVLGSAERWRRKTNIEQMNCPCIKASIAYKKRYQLETSIKLTVRLLVS